MAFAKAGFVLLSTMPSEVLPPGGNNQLEMPKDNLAYQAPQTWRTVSFELLNDLPCGLAILLEVPRHRIHRIAINHDGTGISFLGAVIDVGRDSSFQTKHQLELPQ